MILSHDLLERFARSSLRQRIRVPHQDHQDHTHGERNRQKVGHLLFVECGDAAGPEPFVYGLKNQAPIPLSALGITGSPPLGSQYKTLPGWGGVPLFDQ